MNEEDCDHKRIKKTSPHGRNTAPVRVCKDCGKSLSLLDLKKNMKKRNRPRREQEEYPSNYMEEKL